MARILIALLLLPLIGCTTTLNSAWVERERAGKPIRKTLVVGIAEREGQRRTFEDTFVQRLAQVGVQAQASYRVMPEGQPPTRDNVDAAVGNTDCDSVFVTSYVRTDREMVYTEPMTPYYGPGGYYWDRHYSWYYGAVTTPGYWSEVTTVILENNLYDTATGKLIWSAESESFNPSSADEIVRTLADQVINDLRMKRLLPQ
jgi:hypothetical protein